MQKTCEGDDIERLHNGIKELIYHSALQVNLGSIEALVREIHLYSQVSNNWYDLVNIYY